MEHSTKLYRVGSLSMLVFLLISACQLLAQETKSPIVTDRPDQSNTPVLTPTGAFQIESGFVMEVDGKDSLQSTNFTYNNLLLKYGLNRNVEIQVAMSYLGTRHKEEQAPAKGISPASIGLKLRLAEEKGFWPQAALVSHLNVNTAKNSFSTVHSYSDVTLIFSHTFSPRWSFTYNLSAKWDGNNAGAIYAYTVSNAISLGEKLGGFIELYGFLPETARMDHRLDGGFTYKVTPIFQIDISGGVGFYKHSPDFFLGGGMAARFFK